MAARFWKSQPVSGAIVSVASPPQIRLTVSSTTGMTTGDTRTVFGVVGTTEANGTWTITVIDATHIDLQGTTFANLYSSGGNVNGLWDGTNTNNWVTSTGGVNYGQTVPGSADAVTLDGSSGGGTVTVNATITVQSITCGAFTGTLDFSANNNNVTLTGNVGFNGSGSGTRTINLGNGTWTLSGTTPAWSISVITNLTFSANSSTLKFAASAASVRQPSFGGLTYNTITIDANSGGGIFQFSACTAATINITGQNAVIFTNTTTTTITNSFTWVGTSGSEIWLGSNSPGNTATVSVPSGTSTMTWAGIRDIAFTGGATFTATNSFDLGHNSGITITPPAGGTVAFAGMTTVILDRVKMIGF